jgi:hypothetical protein
VKQKTKQRPKKEEGSGWSGGMGSEPLFFSNRCHFLGVIYFKHRFCMSFILKTLLLSKQFLQVCHRGEVFKEKSKRFFSLVSFFRQKSSAPQIFIT